MEVRRLQNNEVLDGLHLAWEVFVKTVAPAYRPEGVEQFQRYIKLEQILSQLQSGHLAMFGAFEGGELIGVSAVQSDGHITLLFVREDSRHRGAGRALLQEMCRYCSEVFRQNRLTLSAAPGAAEACRRMGFMPLAEEQERGGVRFVPMEHFIVPAGTRPQEGKKSYKWLIVGISAVVLLLLILMGLLCGKVVNEIVKMDQSGQLPEVFGDIGGEYEGPSQGNEDGQPESPQGGGNDSQTEPGTNEDVGQGIEAIQCFTEENLPYTIQDKSYIYNSGKSSDDVLIRFEVHYPQLEGAEGAQLEKVNQILEDCAMSTVNTLYLDPSEDMKDTMLKTKNPVLVSHVTYQVTYAGADFISVAFNDEYLAGNTEAGYVDLRTRNIRLSDAKEFEVADIVELSDAFMQDWMERMRQEAPGQDVLYGVKLNEFKRILGGDILENRYFDAFFVDAKGMEIGLTYHYDNDGREESGWITAPFKMDEVKNYKTDSEFWGLIHQTD